MSETNKKPAYIEPEPRMAYGKAFPEGLHTLMAWGKAVRMGGLEHSLLELVKMRASILNGCAYCCDLHAREAMEAGETTRRLFALAAWQEAPFFTSRERAALRWTDVITNIQDGHAEECEYSAMREHFDEHEAVVLTMAIANINSWNRMAIAFRPHVGK